ncbi:hypothetical protein Clacol_007291 [Clathrus columnatus]|uniref:F-box domain-containing protein n=1 Tax=Clathrus columnatus TaxID=1419009 RepID=A0AAV5AH39_9AGAM|nr:hypothetical protein Clacol_007291 [Clathrus columnatus]
MTLHGKLALPTSSNLSGRHHQAPLIYRLPVEILSRIFEFGTCRVDDGSLDEYFDMNLVNFPIRIAAVSKKFRTIAHSTPSLWTTLHFYSPRPSWYDPKSDAQPGGCVYDYTRDRLWLTRSRACPLDLMLYYRDVKWTFTEERHYFRPEHMEYILSLLEPHAWRIRRFTLVCDTFAPIHASLEFFSRKGETMSKLNILELYRCNEYVAEYPRFYPSHYAKPLVLPLDKSPLKRMILGGVHIDWDCWCKSEALRHLDTLDISYHSPDARPSLDAFVETLRASPNLKTLSVIGSGPVGLRQNTTIGIHESQPQIEAVVIASDHMKFKCFLPKNLPSLPFRHLSVLKLGFYHINDAILIISLVFSPALGGHPPITDLTLKDLSRPSEVDTAHGSNLLIFLASLCDFDIPEPDYPARNTEDTPSVKGSHYSKREIGFPFTTTLRHLTLESIKATEKAFTGFLNISPCLETLSLDGVSSCILLALCPPHIPSNNSDSETSSPSIPCPNLKTVSLRFLDFPTERITSYTALARSRAVAGSPLERLSIYHWDITYGLRQTDAETAKEHVTSSIIEVFGSEDEFYEEEEEEDPFAPGGTFNDPEFDALFSTGT